MSSGKRRRLHREAAAKDKAKGKSKKTKEISKIRNNESIH